MVLNSINTFWTHCVREKSIQDAIFFFFSTIEHRLADAPVGFQKTVILR